MTGRGRFGPLAFRAFGRFHRDARLILVTSLVAGAAISLWWIDFNLYLVSLGFAPSTIGLVSTLASLAGGLVAFPASALSDRYGRRAAFALGISASLAALIALLAGGSTLPLIVAAAALWSMGNQTFQVVVSPYMTEHSEPEHRNELFAVQFAIQNVTNIVAAVLGGVVATAIAASLGFEPGGPGTYRIILVIMAVLLLAGLVTVFRLADDRPSRVAKPAAAARRGARGVPGRPAPVPDDPRDHDPGSGAVREARPARVPHLDRRGAGHPVPQPLRPAQVRAGPRAAQRGVRADVARDRRRDPAPAAARPAVRADHLGRHRPGRLDPVPRRARLLADPVDRDPRDGGAELADERGQPHLQRVLDGAGGTGRAGDAGRGDERPVAGGLGHRRHLVRPAPGNGGLRDRLRDQLRHDHHAVHGRDDPLLDVVPARGPGARATPAAAA